MTRSRLKNRANKTGNEEDIKKYKKQRNLVVKLNRASKHYFFKKLEPANVDNDEKFWKAVKPLFSNTDPMSNKIILVENGEILQEETRVAENLNSYFLNIIDTLDLDPFFKDTDQNGTVDQKVNQAIEKYKNHDSVLRIKEQTKKPSILWVYSCQPRRNLRTDRCAEYQKSIKWEYTIEGPKNSQNSNLPPPH